MKMDGRYMHKRYKLTCLCLPPSWNLVNWLRECWDWHPPMILLSNTKYSNKLNMKMSIFWLCWISNSILFLISAPFESSEANKIKAKKLSFFPIFELCRVEPQAQFSQFPNTHRALSLSLSLSLQVGAVFTTGICLLSLSLFSLQ